ncbi:MAG: REP-associated tyrosine transposase [Thermodesulfobacteriota bacterium]
MGKPDSCSRPGCKALRHGRHSAPGIIYHVTTSTLDRYPYFRDFPSGRLVVREMRRLEEEGHVDSLAWVLMPDHLHWLFRLKGRSSLAQAMGMIKGRSAFTLNRRLHRRGPIWQKAFYEHAMRADEDLVATARYIVANPVRAGVVQRVMDYPLWDAVWI